MKHLLKTFSLILALAAVVCLTACGKTVRPENGSVVMTLDGEKIYYDYYAYVYFSARDSVDGGDRSYWTGNLAAQTELADDVLSVLVRNKAIKKLADDHDISLSKEEKKALDAELDAYRASFPTEEDYENALTESHATEYSYRYISELMALWQKAYDTVTDESSGIIKCSDEVLLSDVAKNFRRIKYILIDNSQEGYLKKAAEVKEKLDAGESFEKMIKDYNQDFNMETLAETGRYYTLGEIDAEVEEAVEELAENEISTVLDLDSGCFIIMRLPIDYDYVDSDMESFRQRYFARVFNEMIAEREKDIKVEYGSAFSDINVLGN